MARYFLLCFFACLFVGACSEDSEMRPRPMTQEELYRGEMDAGMGVGNAPKKRHGWSQGGTLTTGNLTKTVGLQVTFDEPDVYTVQIGATFPITTALNPIQAEAIVRWSVAGNTILRKVTPGAGVSISASAEAVSVLVSDVTNLLGAPDDYGVVITCSRGVRAPNGQPPILFPPFNAGVNGLIVIGPANVFDVPVPIESGATSVQVTIGDPQGAIIPDNAVIVEQRAPAPLNRLRVCDPRDLSFIPLMPATTFIRINNVSNVNPVFAVVSFGVDG